MIYILTSIISLSLFAFVADNPDINTIPADLIVPPVKGGNPAPGKRVRQVAIEYEGTQVYHLLYLPVDWEKGKKYPVIVEYAGNKYITSPGTVEGSNLGYGISTGKDYIWLCLPYISQDKQQNQLTWWGNLEATVDYCKMMVPRICNEFGGDTSAVFIAGFSRGSIACNFIGLYDDEIAALWSGFICHSHYDGVKQWDYPGSDRQSAAERIKRLQGRPQFISHELSVEKTQQYLLQVFPGGDFTFLAIPYQNHTDTWVLRDIPERQVIRDWLADLVVKE